MMSTGGVEALRQWQVHVRYMPAEMKVPLTSKLADISTCTLWKVTLDGDTPMLI